MFPIWPAVASQPPEPPAKSPVLGVGAASTVVAGFARGVPGGVRPARQFIVFAPTPFADAVSNVGLGLFGIDCSFNANGAPYSYVIGLNSDADNMLNLYDNDTGALWTANMSADAAMALFVEQINACAEKYKATPWRCPFRAYIAEEHVNIGNVWRDALVIERVWPTTNPDNTFEILGSSDLLTNLWHPQMRLMYVGWDSGSQGVEAVPVRIGKMPGFVSSRCGVRPGLDTHVPDGSNTLQVD